VCKHDVHRQTPIHHFYGLMDGETGLLEDVTKGDGPAIQRDREQPVTEFI
jgi:hypothetical protein